MSGDNPQQPPYIEEKRLLVLDDDPLIGRMLYTIAQRAMIAAQYTSDPEEFFQLLDSWRPTHIALDLVMPLMDGVQVIVELAKRKCTASIIITSGQGSRVLEAAARSAAWHGLTIQAVIGKPFSPSAFRRLLDDGPSPSQYQETAPVSQRAAVELSIEDLITAIRERQVQVVFQPKVRCQDGVLVGHEVLARWTHPGLGPISPDRFIPLAENSGLIDDLTELVLDQALDWLNCEDLAGSNEAVAGRFVVPMLSINISTKSLGNALLLDAIEARCQAYNIRPERIILEVTETSAMENPVMSLDVLTRLRLRGFQLSIDDFGTGFSSMAQLVRLPFSELKVDKSFVMGARNSAEYRTVIKSVVNLGHSLGMKCTAEGLEDVETLSYLNEVGCDLAQGYYISKPLSAANASQWARSRRAEPKAGHLE